MPLRRRRRALHRRRRICTPTRHDTRATISIIIIAIIVIISLYEHKAAGRKTRLGIQNYCCNGNLLVLLLL